MQRDLERRPEEELKEERVDEAEVEKEARSFQGTAMETKTPEPARATLEPAVEVSERKEEATQVRADGMPQEPRNESAGPREADSEARREDTSDAKGAGEKPTDESTKGCTPEKLQEKPEKLQEKPDDKPTNDSHEKGVVVPSSRGQRQKADQDGSGSEDDEPSCRICRSGEEAGKLYCPCRCAGSIKWIHESCLKSWLQSQDRRPVCELCGYAFEYTRVYSEHAPHRLTAADWMGAFGTTALSVSKRAVRIAYATLVWGIALPLLTVNSAHILYGRGRGLAPSEFRQVLPFTLNVFMGECLSLAGIAVIYVNSLIPGLLAMVVPATAPAPVPAPGAAAAPAAAAAAPAAAATAPAAAAAAPAPAAAAARATAAGTTAAARVVQEPRPVPRPDQQGAATQPRVAAQPVPSQGPPQAQRQEARAAPPQAAAEPVRPRPAQAGSEEEDLADAEEDLWNIMGLQGNPLRALGCMVTFLGANVIGVGLFLAIPFYIGRLTLTWLMPIIQKSPLGGLSVAVVSEWVLRLLGVDPPPPRGGGAAGGSASHGAAAPPAATPPLVESEGLVLAEAWLNETDVSSVAELARPFELPPLGQSPFVDLGALTAGYLSLATLLIALIPSGLLLGAALGCSNRGPEVLRSFASMAVEQARQTAISTWLRLQMLAILLLQLVLVPCYIGHLVVCLLCGPVLHLPQETRAAMANGNLPLTLVMQLFIGYVHLWGIAFLEGCVADICVPAVLRNASSNFFIGALCSHRRLFGTGSVSNTSTEWPLLLPVSHLTALKLALVHVAFHTPLAFVLWHLPARLLDRLLGEMLFPVHLVDHTVGPPGALRGDGLPRRELDITPGGNAASGAEPGRNAMPGQPGDATPFFAIEMLQLYILVLQCLRVLDASPGLSRLIATGLRSTFRSLGLQHLLAEPSTAALPSGMSAEDFAQRVLAAEPAPPGFRVVDGGALVDGGLLAEAAIFAGRAPPTPAPATVAPAATAAPGAAAPVAATPPAATAVAEGTRQREAVQEQGGGNEEVAQPLSPRRWRPLLVLWQLLVVGSLLVSLSWTCMALMLSLPLTVGRTLVRYILAQQATRVSDFLPLSLGVVVFSAVILAVVKVSEALPVITARASTLEQRRCVHLLLCTVSSTIMALAILVLIPLGLGTLLLRLVLPLKAHSVYQVPIVFLVTDCWSLGLVLTKVVWRLVQTDVMLHDLHLEFAAAWADVQGSLTNLFFDLGAHRRIWRRLIMPMLEAITLHLLLPRTVALTLLRYGVPEDQEYLRSALLMYCYHLVLGVRLWFIGLPVAQSWISDMRQRIFDAKYLVSTELRNYHT